MSEQTEKKILSPEQAVQAACILFELNTREQDLLEMAQRAGVPCDDEASRRALTREWYGFVHAAVVYLSLIHISMRGVCVGRWESANRADASNMPPVNSPHLPGTHCSS